MCSTQSPKGISLPERVDVPFFAYGALKPGEPAHYRVEPFLAKSPIPATISGVLRMLDGLPLLDLHEKGTVNGFLLYFHSEVARNAYETICQFEPRNHYAWRKNSPLKDRAVTAHVLIGKQLQHGRAVPLESDSWTFRNDPVFSKGLKVIRDVIKSEAAAKFEGTPPEDFDWKRFFTLQMAYLLLWSAVERYTALVVGAGLDPMARVRQFGRLSIFQEGFKKAGISRQDEVWDSRDPADRFILDASDPSTAILYYYQVRNNLSHRGKGAWKDGEIVRNSLRELHMIFTSIVDAPPESPTADE